MEFNKKLYELRKQKGISQEELAEKLNVTRQTLSKWELGTSTPDMERLVAIADYFEISLDELVLGKEKKTDDSSGQENSTLAQILDDKVLTEENKVKSKKVLKYVGVGIIVIVGIDVLSLIIAFFAGMLK